jgi:hypothetical protein
MQIGILPHECVWQRGDLYIVEDKEFCSYTLYRVKETVMNPKPKTADSYMEGPYDYDLATGVMRVLEKLGTQPVTDLGIDLLLDEVPVM